jgi:hypothetical protein
MKRIVQPEQLDELPSEHPLAIASRKDLQRLNTIMGSAGILAGAFIRHRNSAPPKKNRISSDAPKQASKLSILEIGSGDGSLHLRFARHCAHFGITANSSLLDLKSIVPTETIHGFESLHWTATPVQSDVFEHLRQTETTHDAIFANLFLHHFKTRELETLLGLIAQRTRFFAACEPRRSPLPLLTANSLWAIGCNSVTRNDAVISVKAGFIKNELSELWPKDPKWILQEHSAGLFNHCFIATANA